MTWELGSDSGRWRCSLVQVNPRRLAPALAPSLLTSALSERSGPGLRSARGRRQRRAGHLAPLEAMSRLPRLRPVLSPLPPLCRFEGGAPDVRATLLQIAPDLPGAKFGCRHRSARFGQWRWSAHVGVALQCLTSTSFGGRQGKALRRPSVASNYRPASSIASRSAVMARSRAASSDRSCTEAANSSLTVMRRLRSRLDEGVTSCLREPGSATTGSGPAAGVAGQSSGDVVSAATGRSGRLFASIQCCSASYDTPPLTAASRLPSLIQRRTVSSLTRHNHAASRIESTACGSCVLGTTSRSAREPSARLRHLANLAGDSRHVLTNVLNDSAGWFTKSRGDGSCPTREVSR